MTETLHTDQPLPEKAHPGEVAAFLKRRTQTLGSAATELAEVRDTKKDTLSDIKPPKTGGEFITISGEVLFFAPAHKHVFDPRTGGYTPKPYTLRDYFSHTASDGINGPGWDLRSGLHDLTEEQMLERYGHVFTRAEIQSPGGARDDATGELTGGMPDNIPYYDLVDQEEYEYRKTRGLL